MYVSVTVLYLWPERVENTSVCPRGETSQCPYSGQQDGREEAWSARCGTRLQERAVVTPEECASFSLGMGGTIKWLARNKAGLLLCTVYKEEESLF